MTQKPASGSRVRIVDAGLLPTIRSYVGQEGITERPETDGCYVRFPDHSYVWCYWPELVPVAVFGQEGTPA